MAHTLDGAPNRGARSVELEGNNSTDSEAECELKLGGTAIAMPITTGAQPLGDEHDRTPALTLIGSTQYLASGKEKAAGTYTVEVFCKNVQNESKVQNVNIMAWAG